MTQRQYIRAFAITVTLWSALVATDLSYAAGRIFYDGFEDGTTNAWNQDSFRNKCTVVSSAADGVVGPFAGTKMTRCNSDGTVATNSPPAYETMTIPSNNYTNELFIRTHVRIDTNSQRTSGSAQKILRIFFWDGGSLYHDIFGGVTFSPGLHNGGDWKFQTPIPNYNGNAPGDNSANSSSWHKVEYYVNQSAGSLKVWHDGILIRNDTGFDFAGVKWSPFFITSNWSDPHGTPNYVYFDEFEMYTDNGTGATGLMSDASIQQSGGGGDVTPPTDPSSLIATAISSSRIDLSWTASTDAVGVTNYLVERALGAGSFSQVGTPASNAFSDTGLAESASYRHRVRATDAAGNLSGYSNVTTMSTLSVPPAAPTNLRVQ